MTQLLAAKQTDERPGYTGLFCKLSLLILLPSSLLLWAFTPELPQAAGSNPPHILLCGALFLGLLLVQVQLALKTKRIFNLSLLAATVIVCLLLLGGANLGPWTWLNSRTSFAPLLVPLLVITGVYPQISRYTFRG